MQNKIRIDGETIDPRRTYRGDRVLELLNISYKNGYDSGYRKGRDEGAQDAGNAYVRGRTDGRIEASKDLESLRTALKRILDP